MLDDFKAALARIQGDYDFYVGCQIDPDCALAAYDLSPDEKGALSDPGELTKMLRENLSPVNLPSITITISGRHDWVNRTKKAQGTQDPVLHEITAIKSAPSYQERLDAVLRMIERIG